MEQPLGDDELRAMFSKEELPGRKQTSHMTVIGMFQIVKKFAEGYNDHFVMPCYLYPTQSVNLMKDRMFPHQVYNYVTAVLEMLY